MRNNQIAYHSYADDAQNYLASSPNDYSPIDIAFGNKDEVLKVNTYLDSRGQKNNQVNNRGVIRETDLSFSSHVKAVTKSAYYHLKKLQELEVLFPVKIWRNLFMSLSPARWIIVMVSSPAFQRRPLDSCSSSRTLLPRYWLEPENLFITPVLRSLHWLPVIFRIDFKVLLLVYKSLNGLGPKYITDKLTEYKPNRPLRLVGSSQLEIPMVHKKTGQSALSYFAAPQLESASRRDQLY